MKKKLAALFLGVSLVFTGCGGSTTSGNGQSEQAQEAEQNTEELDTAEEPDTGEAVSGDNNTQDSATQDSATQDSEVQGSDAQDSDTQESGGVVEEGSVSENEEVTQEENKAQTTPVEGQETVMESIYNAIPGTAGSSLKAVSAAAGLLDWIMDKASGIPTDQITAQATEWAKEKLENGTEADELLDGLASVQAEAMLIQADMENAADQLEDAGAELKHDDYSNVDVSAICDAIRAGIQAAAE